MTSASGNAPDCYHEELFAVRSNKQGVPFHLENTDLVRAETLGYSISGPKANNNRYVTVAIPSDTSKFGRAISLLVPNFRIERDLNLDRAGPAGSDGAAGDNGDENGNTTALVNISLQIRENPEEVARMIDAENYSTPAATYKVLKDKYVLDPHGFPLDEGIFVNMDDDADCARNPTGVAHARTYEALCRLQTWMEEPMCASLEKRNINTVYSGNLFNLVPRGNEMVRHPTKKGTKVLGEEFRDAYLERRCGRNVQVGLKVPMKAELDDPKKGIKYFESELLHDSDGNEKSGEVVQLNLWADRLSKDRTAWTGKPLATGIICLSRVTVQGGTQLRPFLTPLLVRVYTNTKSELGNGAGDYSALLGAPVVRFSEKAAQPAAPAPEKTPTPPPAPAPAPAPPAMLPAPAPEDNDELESVASTAAGSVAAEPAAGGKKKSKKRVIGDGEEGGKKKSVKA